jgi:hypothetical protein
MIALWILHSAIEGRVIGLEVKKQLHLYYITIPITSTGNLCSSAITPNSDEHSAIPLTVGSAPELGVVVLASSINRLPKDWGIEWCRR